MARWNRTRLLKRVDEWQADDALFARNGEREMKAPETQAEHLRQLHNVKSSALARIRKPSGQKLNHLEIRAESQRRIAERLTPGHPKEVPERKGHRCRKLRSRQPQPYHVHQRCRCQYNRRNRRGQSALATKYA
jgi:hypothetical protein